MHCSMQMYWYKQNEEWIAYPVILPPLNNELFKTVALE